MIFWYIAVGDIDGNDTECRIGWFICVTGTSKENTAAYVKSDDTKWDDRMLWSRARLLDM